MNKSSISSSMHRRGKTISVKSPGISLPGTRPDTEIKDNEESMN